MASKQRATDVVVDPPNLHFDIQYGFRFYDSRLSDGLQRLTRQQFNRELGRVELPVDSDEGSRPEPLNTCTKAILRGRLAAGAMMRITRRYPAFVLTVKVEQRGVNLVMYHPRVFDSRRPG